jgi:hypothetical protein
VDATTNILTQPTAFWSSTLLLILALLVLSLWQPLTPHHDPREPPIANASAPFIGHLIGLLRHQIAYLNRLSAEVKLPMYTLSILSWKTYVLASPQYF